MKNKKAQESRNDMLMLYVVCFLGVVMAVGGLYGFGIFGSSNVGSSITAAAISNTPLEEIKENNQSDQNDSNSLPPAGFTP